MCSRPRDHELASSNNLALSFTSAPAALSILKSSKPDIYATLQDPPDTFHWLDRAQTLRVRHISLPSRWLIYRSDCTPCLLHSCYSPSYIEYLEASVFETICSGHAYYLAGGALTRQTVLVRTRGSQSNHFVLISPSSLQLYLIYYIYYIYRRQEHPRPDRRMDGWAAARRT